MKRWPQRAAETPPFVSHAVASDASGSGGSGGVAGTSSPVLAACCASAPSMLAWRQSPQRQYAAASSTATSEPSGKAPPHRVGAQAPAQQPRERHPHEPECHRQDDQWWHHGSGGTHHAEQYEAEAEKQERPNHDRVEVLRDGDRRAIVRQEDAERATVEQIDHRDQRAGPHEVVRHTDAGDGRDAIQRCAPTFWAATEDTAAPTASEGIWIYVHNCDAAPQAAVVCEPYSLTRLIITSAEEEITTICSPIGRPFTTSARSKLRSGFR